MSLASAVPKAPQNVRAVEISEPIGDNCIILVTWDPPANTDQSDIDRYTVNVPSRNIVDNETSAISLVRIPNCHSDDSIQVAAVNRFGCVGMNSSEVQPSLSFNRLLTTEGTHGSTTIHSTPIGSTSGYSKSIVPLTCNNVLNFLLCCNCNLASIANEVSILEPIPTYRIEGNFRGRKLS